MNIYYAVILFAIFMLCCLILLMTLTVVETLKQIEEERKNRPECYERWVDHEME